MRILLFAAAAAVVGGAGYLLSRRSVLTSPVILPTTPRLNPHAWADETARRRRLAAISVELTDRWRKPPPPTSANLDRAMNEAADALNMTPSNKRDYLPPRRPDDGNRAGDTQRARPIIGETAYWDMPPPPTAADLQRAENDAAADLDMTPGAIAVKNGARYPHQYDGLIVQAAQQSHLSPQVLKAMLMTESSLRPDAIGPETRFGTAKGIAQFIDDTWQRWGQGGDVFNPKDAIPASARYLRWLMDRDGVNGDYRNALIAYNQGIGNFWKGKRYPAAVNYADKILNIAQP